MSEVSARRRTDGRVCQDRGGGYGGSSVACVLKHFPGMEATRIRTRAIAYDDRTYETFETSDFLPFEAGIASGAQLVLVSHNVVSCMDSQYSGVSLRQKYMRFYAGSWDFPASLSRMIWRWTQSGI